MFCDLSDEVYFLGRSEGVSLRDLRRPIKVHCKYELLFFLCSGTGKKSSPTWKDPKTGLEWQCESPDEMSWYEAKRYSKSLSLDGKRDWRLPSLAELESLLDRTKARSDGRPLMREEVPFRYNLSYWSSTTFERDTNNAWIVMFDGAYVLSYYKSNLYRVRCVRG